MFGERLLEVYGVSFANVLNVKVINEQAKHDWEPSVLPEPRCEGEMVVVVNLLALFYEDLCQSSRLGQAINAVANMKVNPTFGINEVLQVVFVDKFLGCVGNFDVDILQGV